MAGYVIHTPTVLAGAQAARAADLGPSHVNGPAAPDDLARAVGFHVLDIDNVTPNFRETCAALLAARDALESELRSEEGDAVYEEERAKKAKMLFGIDEGLLLRSVIVTEKAA